MDLFGRFLISSDFHTPHSLRPTIFYNHNQLIVCVYKILIHCNCKTTYRLTPREIESRSQEKGLLGTGLGKYYLRKWRSSMLAGHVARHYGILSGGEKEKGGRIPAFCILPTTRDAASVQLLKTRTRVIGEFTKTHGS